MGEILTSSWVRQVIPYVFFHCQHLIAPEVMFPASWRLLSRICSQQQSIYIFGDCAFQILLQFLSHFSYFSPIHNNSTDSPSCAGSLTSRSPICRCPRLNASSGRRRNRRNLLLCRRYRRPSWVGRWGRNHGQNGGGDQTANEDGDIVPTLPYPSWCEIPSLNPLVLDGRDVKFPEPLTTFLNLSKRRVRRRTWSASGCSPDMSQWLGTIWVPFYP